MVIKMTEELKNSVKELVTYAGLDSEITEEFINVLENAPADSNRIRLLELVIPILKEMSIDKLLVKAVKHNRKSITMNRNRIAALEFKFNDIISNEKGVLLHISDFDQQEIEKLKKISEKSNKSIKEIAINSSRKFLEVDQ